MCSEVKFEGIVPINDFVSMCIVPMLSVFYSDRKFCCCAKHAEFLDHANCVDMLRQHPFETRCFVVVGLVVHVLHSEFPLEFVFQSMA